MASFRRSFVGPALLVSISACISTNAVRLGTGAARPPIASTAVAIYRTADQVPRRYEEVALLNSTGASQWTNEAQMFENMRKVAGQMGANAVILDALSEPGAGAKVAAAVFGTTTQRKGRAIAVFVLPQETILASRGAVTTLGTNSSPAAVQGPSAAGTIAVPVPVNETLASSTEAETRAPQARSTGSANSLVPTIKKTSSALSTPSGGSKPAASTQADTSTSATAVIGEPSSEDARRKAVDAYREGKVYVGRHEWSKAEAKFRDALRLDGSIAQYHGALGSVYLVLHRWQDAQASLSAAVLLDVDNIEYRQMLKEARSHP